MRVPTIIAVVAGLALIAAACTAAHPTPIYLYTTAPSPSDSATPEDTATLTPDSGAPTDTPAGQSALPTATVVVPRTASPSPSPSPTRAAGGCAGSADTLAFFEDAANHLKFGVYCGGVTKGWHFSGAKNDWPGASRMSATYAGPSGAQIVIKEGAFCTAGSSACSPHDTYVGAANFGNLSGGLYTLGPGLGYAIYVAAGTTQGYTATGTAVSQATFAKIVAALYLVPKTAT
jgi:hypothetical protein